MYDYCILGATLLDSASEWNRQTAHICIQQGVIVKIISAKNPEILKAHKIIDAKGAYCAPGLVAFLVDLPEPGFEYRDTFTTLSAAALAGGFTDIVFLPNSQPVLQDSLALQALYQQTKNLPQDCHFTCAATQDAQGKNLNELLELSQSGAVAFTDGLNPIQEPECLLNALRYLTQMNGLLIQFPIDFRLYFEGIINESPATAGMGFKASPGLAEVLMLQTLLECGLYTGARLHISPITTARALQILKNYIPLPSYISISTALEYIIWEDIYTLGFNSLYKTFPPLRSEQDKEALIDGLLDDTIQAIATRHSPKSLEEKEVEFEYATPGLIYMPFVLPLAYEVLCRRRNLNLENLLDKLGNNIRSILGLPTALIQPGNEAKLTFFEITEPYSLEWKACYSKSVNYPKTLPFSTIRIKGIFNKGKWFIG
jgi:dihydroorotase